MATKSKFAQTVPPVAARKTIAKPIVAEPVQQSTHAANVDEVLDAQPTWKRKLTAAVLGIAVVYVSAKTLGGIVLALTFAAVTLTGMGFISFVTMLLGVLAAFFISLNAGLMTHNFVMAFEASRVRDRFSAFTNSVKARFNPQPVEA